MCCGCREVVKSSWQVVRPWMGLFHGTYQHEAITSRSRQLLLMGTWLPETCWATIRREIKNTKKLHLVGFSYPHWITMHGQPHIRLTRLVLGTCWSMDALPANWTWQPPCSHGPYQHEVITSRTSQLLMMGTCLSETCWATIRREIKNTKSDICLIFLIHTELRCTVNHTSGVILRWKNIYDHKFWRI